MLGRPKKNGSGKTWVKELLPVTEKPFDYLEFDIKYIRVDGTGRNAMLLTVVDVLSRYNMGHLLQYSIKKEVVVELFKDIFSRFAFPTRITVRSDNGSQFIAERTHRECPEFRGICTRSSRGPYANATS